MALNFLFTTKREFCDVISPADSRRSWVVEVPVLCKRPADGVGSQLNVLGSIRHIEELEEECRNRRVVEVSEEELVLAVGSRSRVVVVCMNNASVMVLGVFSHA